MICDYAAIHLPVQVNLTLSLDLLFDGGVYVSKILEKPIEIEFVILLKRGY
jgi:hypothetical protein